MWGWREPVSITTAIGFCDDNNDHDDDD